MELEYLFNLYKKHNKNYELNPMHHRTYIALLLSKISKTLEWFSKSNNSNVDIFTSSIYNLSEFYKKLKDFDKENIDESEVHIIKNKEPSVLIKQLVDIFVHLLIYIRGNNWDKYFLTILEKTIIEDNIQNEKKIV